MFCILEYVYNTIHVLESQELSWTLAYVILLPMAEANIYKEKQIKKCELVQKKVDR